MMIIFKKIFFAIGMAHLAATPFKFIAFGEMPYYDKVPLYENLITQINASKAAFSIHIGNTKGKNELCTNEIFENRLDYFNSFNDPLIFIPGDNDWTTCHRKQAGSFDPLERLNYIRKTYYANPSYSLGRRNLALESQALLMGKQFSQYVENSRFVYEEVMFVQLHVVGSNNNFETRSQEAVNEFFSRDDANIVWLEDSFKEAKQRDLRAVVLSFQADIFAADLDRSWHSERFSQQSGFANFAVSLVKTTKEFRKMVLVIYGENQLFRIFRPFLKKAPNLVALEVFGDPYVHAVEISVDPQQISPFSYKPLFNSVKPW